MVAPAACRSDSISEVLPEPAGPTSADVADPVRRCRGGGGSGLLVRSLLGHVLGSFVGFPQASTLLGVGSNPAAARPDRRRRAADSIGVVLNNPAARKVGQRPRRAARAAAAADARLARRRDPGRHGGRRHRRRSCAFRRAGSSSLSCSSRVLTLSDLLDGTMARMAGTSGPWGNFLDATLDRLSDGAIFGGLALYGAFNDQPWITAAATLALVTGQVTSYSKARAEAVGRDRERRDRRAGRAADHRRGRRPAHRPRRAVRPAGRAVAAGRPGPDHDRAADAAPCAGQLRPSPGVRAA